MTSTETRQERYDREHQEEEARRVDIFARFCKAIGAKLTYKKDRERDCWISHYAETKEGVFSLWTTGDGDKERICVYMARISIPVDYTCAGNLELTKKAEGSERYLKFNDADLTREGWNEHSLRVEFKANPSRDSYFVKGWNEFLPKVAMAMERWERSKALTYENLKKAGEVYRLLKENHTQEVTANKGSQYQGNNPIILCIVVQDHREWSVVKLSVNQADGRGEGNTGYDVMLEVSDCNASTRTVKGVDEIIAYYQNVRDILKIVEGVFPAQD